MVVLVLGVFIRVLIIDREQTEAVSQPIWRVVFAMRVRVVLDKVDTTGAGDPLTDCPAVHQS